MAYAVRNLSVLAYANGFTLWHYKSGTDRLDAVTAPDYFEDAGDMLSRGDIMMLSVADGSRIVCISVAGNAIATAPLG